MKIKKVSFYYFSGTGNTLLVVKKMTEVFRELNVKVDLYNIVDVEPDQIDTATTVGIAFPVACLSTYRLVWEFLEKIPQGNGAEFFMVDTMAVLSGIVPTLVRQIITRKGYLPLGAKEIIMPHNINFESIKEEKNRLKTDKGLVEAKRFAHHLLYGVSGWKKVPLVPSLFRKLQMQERAWSYLTKKFAFSVDNIKCIRCGICYRLCPVDNIEMEEYPEYLAKCQCCMRCISFCPTQAISMKNKGRFFPYKAVEHEEMLK